MKKELFHMRINILGEFVFSFNFDKNRKFLHK